MYGWMGACMFVRMYVCKSTATHDDVIKWKLFPRYWPFVRRIYRSPLNFPHTGQWRGALTFSLICARINSWVNNGEAGDLRRHRTNCDVIVMKYCIYSLSIPLYILNPRSNGVLCKWYHWRKQCDIPDSKVHGANMGPIWGRQGPGGPHVCPMNFAIWDD